MNCSKNTICQGNSLNLRHIPIMKEWIKPEIELLEISQTLATCNVAGKVEGIDDSNDTLNCATTS